MEKINIGNCEYYDDCNISLDLDGDNQEIHNRTYNRSNINNTRQEDIKEEHNKIITVEVDDANE